MDFAILGPLEVRTAGGALPLRAAKPRALLAILLLNANEVVSTDRLIEALWGERPPGTAIKALQVHVSQLRKAIGASAIETKPPGYVLRVEPARLDLKRFERLHEEARALLDTAPAEAQRLLSEALALWRGRALADFEYEAFAQPEIARLEGLRLAALEDRFAADLALGGHAAVIGELEALILDHPLRERLRAQLMLALYRSGRQAEALEAYQDARHALTEELGIEPGRELRELQRAVLGQDSELDLRPDPEPEVDERRRSVFVGRERELTELMGALEEALAGHARVVLLAGEPGIGKSRLADELILRARGRGARLLVGRCWEAGGAPAYWPWVQALRAYVRESDPQAVRAQAGPEAADLATMLPELRELLPDLPVGTSPASEGARFRLMESVASFLRRAASTGPLLLFIDDLHAADASSLLLLRFAAAQLAGSPILILGCYRDTEGGPELADAVAELSHEPACRRLSLQGLGAADVSQLLEQTMGAAPDEGLAAQVQAGTQGNPLFATEIARLVGAEGPPEPGTLPIPEGVRQTIARRVQRQSERCQSVLTLASAMGREFDPEVIGRLTDLDEDELFVALDEAANARLVSSTPEASGRLRFSHILVRDTLYEGLPAPRRLRLHRAIGDALEAVFAASADAHLAELAHHYLEGGTAAAGKAIDYARRAGDRAMSQHGYDEAARLYARALELLETAGSPDAGSTCELLLSLGEALSRSGNGGEAKRCLLRAAGVAEQAGRSDQLARAALQYGGRFTWARASTDPGLVPILERALAALGDDDGATRVRLLSRLAGATRDDPLRERRVRLAEEALALAKEVDDPATLGLAIEGHWIAVEGPSVAGEGVGVGAELIALGEEIGDRERVFAGHDHRLHTFWMLADPAGVRVEFDALSRLAGELRQPAQSWHCGTGRTMFALMEGRLEDAEQLIAETASLGRRAQSWNAVVSQRLALFVLRREQGRLAEVEDTIARSVHEYPALLRFRCAFAHLLAELGRERQARTAFDELMEVDLEREYLDAEWFFSMALLVDPCVSLGDRDAAARLHSLLLPYESLYAQAPVEAVFGSLARGLGVLATELGRFEDAERHFGVAIETERRMGARPWLAHAEHDLASMFLARARAGDAERARALVEQALSGYRELGMESWAARAARLAPHAPD